MRIPHRALALLLLALTGACASKTRSYPREDAEKTPPAPSRADTLRARALALATEIHAGRATLTEGSGKLWFPIEAAQAEEVGSVIMAFIVLPNGRVDRESRTIVYLEGHPIFAKSVCDFLLEARVQVERPQAAPAFTTYAATFHIRNQPKPAKVGEQIHEMSDRLRVALFEKTPVEKERWLMARPSCSALKSRDM